MYKAVIVDDEVWTRDVIKSLGDWEGLGISVVGEAEDGETGLALIRQVKPDVIITDVRMPGMNGIELVEQLRREQMDTPVLMVSGYDDYDYVRGAMKLGVTDYLLKPLKQKELNQQLQNCIRQASARGGNALDVISSEWSEKYHSLRERIRTDLQLGRTDLLEKDFTDLENSAAGLLKDDRDPNMLIALYYALLFDLQRCLEPMNLQLKEMFDEEPVFVFRRGNTLHEVLSFVLQIYERAVAFAEEQASRRSRLDIGAVCRFLNDRYAQGITLELTADFFHVSREYLSKAFKQETGQGFTEYVTSLRMKKAMELIRDYHAPVKEAGDIVGYADLPHFYKAFKKYYGITPGEARNGLKTDNKENRSGGKN